MKKKVLLLAAILAMAVIIAVTLCACDPIAQQTEIEGLQEQYANIANAKTIAQKIEITDGEITQFESEKTYTKTDDGYTVTGTEKKFNGVDKLFDETPINETVQKAVDAKPTLKLDEMYFEGGYRLTATGLTATVKQGNIKDVFGISGELKAPTDNLVLEMSASGGHLTSVRISYDSYDSHVVITLTMTY